MSRTAPRIAIVGVAGRMGRTLVNAVMQDDDAVLAGGIVEPGSSLAGADLGNVAGRARRDAARAGWRHDDFSARLARPLRAAALDPHDANAKSLLGLRR